MKNASSLWKLTNSNRTVRTMKAKRVSASVAATQVGRSFLLGYDRRHVSQQALPVPGLDADAHRVEVLLAARPLHIDQALALVLVLDAEAVLAVDCDAAAASNEADDLVARHRLAAVGQ